MAAGDVSIVNFNSSTLKLIETTSGERALAVVVDTVEVAPTLILGVEGAAVVSANASGGDVAVTDTVGVGSHLAVVDVAVSVGASGLTVQLKDGSGNVLYTFYMAANSTYLYAPDSPLILPSASRLFVRTSGAGNISVTARYYSAAD